MRARKCASVLIRQDRIQSFFFWTMVFLYQYAYLFFVFFSFACEELLTGGIICICRCSEDNLQDVGMLCTQSQWGILWSDCTSRLLNEAQVFLIIGRRNIKHKRREGSGNRETIRVCKPASGRIELGPGEFLLRQEVWVLCPSFFFFLWTNSRSISLSLLLSQFLLLLFDETGDGRPSRSWPVLFLEEEENPVLYRGWAGMCGQAFFPATQLYRAGLGSGFGI